MLINVVEEVRVVVDTLVSSRIRQAEGVDGLKHGFQALSENNKENLDKPLLYRLRPTQDSTVAEYANSLKQWTGKATARIVFDSTVDEFMSECLFQMVKGKSNIAIIATTTEGDVFGGFYTVTVTERDKRLWDPNVFAFSFESHGR